jgi:hypothetical protein
VHQPEQFSNDFKVESRAKKPIRKRKMVEDEVKPMIKSFAKEDVIKEAEVRAEELESGDENSREVPMMPNQQVPEVQIQEALNLGSMQE